MPVGTSNLCGGAVGRWRRCEPGQTVVTEGGVWHWRGAAPGQFMTHLAVYEGVPEWGDHVTDGEYPATAGA